MQKKDSIPKRNSLHSDDLLFSENDVTTKMTWIPEVNRQIWYGFYGLCWHHGLVPQNRNHIDKEMPVTEWEAAMLFPNEAIASLEKKFQEKSIYHGIYGHVEIPYLIKGFGSNSTEAMLDCIARYGLANSRVKKRLIDKCIHHDSSQIQRELEEPYVMNMLNFQTLDELEILLSSEGFSEDMIPIYDESLNYKK